MLWNLEGFEVTGLYMGSVPYRGEVVESRVKYGGDVQHRVKLAEPIEVYGAVREYILVGNEYPELGRVLKRAEVV